MKKTALLLAMIIFAVFVLASCSVVGDLEESFVRLGLLEHSDTDNDHKCDLCDLKLSTCVDEDKDHLCDICKEELSQCADYNRDHN